MEEEVRQKMCEENDAYQQMRSKNPFKMMRAMKRLATAVMKNKFCKKCKAVMMEKIMVKKQKLQKGDICSKCEEVFFRCMK